MNLTNDNYYSLEANANYMSTSQFKTFMECEEKAVAELLGTYRRPDTTALLVGSYVDAALTDDLERFQEEHPEIFNKRTGELKSDYRKAEQIVERIQGEPFMWDLLQGEHQQIMTGEIEGVPFKIKMDSFFPGNSIVDLKVMRDFEPKWVLGTSLIWAYAWKYDVQGAIYREIVRQNTGDELPFIIVAATKQEPSDIGVFEIPSEQLDSALEQVKAFAPRFQDIKEGLTAPTRCGECDYCRGTKHVTEVEVL